MTSLFLLGLLYFLPTILGRNKPDATGIFLVNLLLGWTLIGWVAAFIWAVFSGHPTYVQYVPAGGARFCSHCGTPAVSAVQYCGACGAHV
jgi:T4 superinfection immunity protein